MPSAAGGIASMLELPVAQIDADRPFERGTRCGLSSVMAETDAADALEPSRRPAGRLMMTDGVARELLF